MTDDKLPGGYLAWHEWADRQVKAGHKQKRCSHCGLYKFPVERVGDICKKCKVTKTDAEFIDEIAEQTDTLLIEEYERLKAIAARLRAIDNTALLWIAKNEHRKKPSKKPQ